jgi:putative transposase
MPNYRRAFVPGGCWFFTVNLLERRKSLLVDRIDALRLAVAATRRNLPFTIDAFVVLPDHVHAVLTLPPGDADFSTRWRLIKSRFARMIPKQEWLSPVRTARHERGIWQRRFWEHLIRDEDDYARHIEYCYINPVKHKSGQARWRLAALVISPRCARRHLCGGLGWRDRYAGRFWRAVRRTCGSAMNANKDIVGLTADCASANPP